MRELNLLVLLLLISTLSSCGYFFGKKTTISIPDVSMEWKETFQIKLPEGKHVHKLKVRVVGKTTKNFVLNGKEIKSGDMNETIYYSDHYGKDYFIDYIPLEKDNSGYLEVVSTFYY